MHHDNAPAHTSKAVREYLAKNVTVIMPQPPYSLDLAPADILLFQKLKTTMKGNHFATIEEIKEKSKQKLLAVQTARFRSVSRIGKKRWHKCSISEGACFKGAKIAIDIDKKSPWSSR